MREALRKHHISFKHAWAGIVWAILSQPNFRLHIALSIIALGLAGYLHITRFETIVIVLTIILGLTAEMINTSLECVTDLVTTEWRQEAKQAKDVAAGMMLVVAIGAVAVALLIFVPHIISGSWK